MKNLAIQLLKNSTAYSLNQVRFRVEKNQLIIWDTEHSNFYNSELIVLFEQVNNITTYITYQNDRCELVVFW